MKQVLQKKKKKSIYSTCSKRVVDVMERNSINWIDLLNIVLLQTMTFECIFLLLYFWTWIQIFHCNTTFNRTQNITLPKKIEICILEFSK